MCNNNYLIFFSSGELEGRSFALQEKGLMIGRSKSADIRPASADIVPEHIELIPQSEGGVLLRIPADGKVSIRGKVMNSRIDKTIMPGDYVTLGTTLTFILKEDTSTVNSITSDAISDNDSFDEDETQDELGNDNSVVETPLKEKSESSSSQEDNSSCAAKEVPENGKPSSEDSFTRYASDAEIAELSRLNSHLLRKKLTVIISGLIVIILIFGGAYFYNYTSTENPVTWPGEVTDEYNDGEFKTEIGEYGKFMVYYPQSPEQAVKSDESNFEIMTALGKRFDVPFHIRFTVEKLENGFSIPTLQSCREWINNMADKENFAFLSEPKLDFYNLKENGYPYYKINYVRSVNDFRWQGIASYMRFEDREIILLREVPVAEYWRAKQPLEDYGCLVVAPITVRAHWEVPESFLEGDDTFLLQLIKAESRKSFSAADNDTLDIALKTLLSRASQSNDKTLLANMQTIWFAYRKRQQTWYNQKCLAHDFFEREGKTSEKTRIVNECLQKFKSPDDYRYKRIRDNIWEVD